MIASLNRRNFLREIALAVAVGLGLAFVVLVLSSYNLPMRLVILVIGCLGGLLVALTFGDVKRLLLMAIYLDVSLALDFHLTCNEDYFLTTCGFDISTTVIALVGLYALWLIDLRRAQRQGMPQFRRGLPLVLATAFVGAAILSLSRAVDLVYGVYQIWIFVVATLLLIYLISHIENQKDVLFFLYCMAFGLALQVALMEFQSLGLVDAYGVKNSSGQRIAGTLHSPNVAGAYLAQLILILLPFMLLKVQRWQKWLLAIVLAFAVHTLIGTQSRAAWTSVAFGFFIIVSWGVWKRWINLKSLSIILLVLAVGAVIFSGPIIQRLTEDDGGSADARAPLAEIAWNMVSDSPVVGIGINNFGLVLHNYIEADQYGAWLNLVHNQWLLIWSETGTVGFVLYVLLWLVTAWQAFKLMRKNHPIYSYVALGILASMAGMSTNMLTQTLGGRAQVQLTWIEAAMITALVWLERHESSILNYLPSRVQVTDRMQVDD